MNKRIVFFEGTKLILDTCMTQSAFTKSRFSEQIGTSGHIASKDGSSWNFDPWSFSETQLSDLPGGTVSFTAEAFPGNTLREILCTENDSDENKTRARGVAAAVCSAIEGARAQKINLEHNGGEGIFISSDCTKIIFLPEVFFTTAASSLGDEMFSDMQGLYVNANLTKDDSLAFTQAVIAYRMLAHQFPFPSKNTKERSEDILDANFKPLELLVPQADKQLAKTIDSALSLVPRQKKSSQKPAALFPAEAFVKTMTEEPALCDLTTSAEYAKKENSVKRHRWFRRHRAALTTAFAVTAVAVFILGTYFDSQMEKPTTRGLTSQQTVEMHYGAANRLDIESAQNSTAGGEMKGRVNILSNIYVSTKTRALYDAKLTCLTPAKWFCYNQTTFNIFGLTDFKINEQQATLYTKGAERKHAPKAITQENNIPLKNGDTKTYIVSFYMLRTEGSDEMFVTKIDETVNLVFKKNRWLIKSTDTVQEENKISKTEFYTDYSKAMKDSSDDAKKAAELLRAKYEWVPSQSELEEAAADIEQNGIFGS